MENKPVTIDITLVSVSLQENIPVLNYFYRNEQCSAVLSNPEVLRGCLITGTELKIRLFSVSGKLHGLPAAELLAGKEDFIPEAFAEMLSSEPPVNTTFFGYVSKPVGNTGRYYMLRDSEADGLLLCTGSYRIKDRVGRCDDFDGQWQLRYNIVENFFYGIKRPNCGLESWRHPLLKLKEIDDTLTLSRLTKRHRDYAAGWHRHNYFFSDDWSLKFYRKQARLGFIAITLSENNKTRLVPQLQREYAVLEWPNLRTDRKIRKILAGGRITAEKIRLQISPDPAEALINLGKAWEDSWITEEYAELITGLAAGYAARKNRNFRVWGVTLTAGDDNKVISGELGYSIGKTYTSLSGFFHRENKNHDNFGKLQMVMLAERLEKAGIEFWNLGQPYMEYKLKLGAEVIPRSIFLKRWDKAVRGRSPDLSLARPGRTQS